MQILRFSNIRCISFQRLNKEVLKTIYVRNAIFIKYFLARVFFSSALVQSNPRCVWFNFIRSGKAKRNAKKNWQYGSVRFY